MCRKKGILTRLTKLFTQEQKLLHLLHIRRFMFCCVYLSIKSTVQLMKPLVLKNSIDKKKKKKTELEVLKLFVRGSKF